MKKLAASVALLFVASIALAAYGHCEAPNAPIAIATHGDTHDDAAHHGPGEAGDCASNAASPALTAMLGSVVAPAKKNAGIVMTVPSTPSVAVRFARVPDGSTGPPQRFSDIYARTGRLLI